MSKNNSSIYLKLKNELNMKFIAVEEELTEMKKNNGITNALEYKILIIGDNLTGKISFCNRFVFNDFDLELKPSTDTNCYLKSIILFGKELKIYLLDVESIPISPLNEKEEKELYSDIDGIIVIYDITQYESFNHIDKLLINTKKKCNKKDNIPIVMIGNKNDLKFLRNIDFAEAKEKAEELKCELREINCNRDENIVDDIIKKLIAKIYFNNLDKDEKEKIKKEAKEYLEKNKI